ncbi:unnamed protein product [Closterium sp. Naga37s-1]|nr:unnamed protein product [Closterium sp. Naga37s-1]
MPVLHHQQFHHVSMAQSAQAAAAAAAAAVAAATASGFPPQRGDQQPDQDQDQQGEQERHQDQQEQRQQDPNQPRQLRPGSPQQGGAMQTADPQQQAQQAQQALQKRKGPGDPAAGSALHACSAPTDLAGNPLRRTLWIRFKHGRPTEVELEEDELHIDHLKKRLKLLFPKMLGHVEVFEFSIRHSAADHGCVPEDFPLDHLREGNRAAAPLLVDAPEPTPNLASAALVAVAPPVCLDPAAGPGGVNLSYVVDGGRDDAFGAMGAVPGSLAGKGIGMGPGGMGGGGMHCDPDDMRQLFHPEAAPPPPAEVKVGGRKRKNAAGGGAGGAGGAGGSGGMAHLGANGLTEISPNSRSKKAADGLHKGQSIIMRYNNEDVAKARIVSCERSGFCKVRLHSLITDGSTLLYENSLPSGLRIPLTMPAHAATCFAPSASLLCAHAATAPRFHGARIMASAAYANWASFPAAAALSFPADAARAGWVRGFGSSAGASVAPRRKERLRIVDKTGGEANKALGIREKKKKKKKKTGKADEKKTGKYYGEGFGTTGVPLARRWGDYDKRQWEDPEGWRGGILGRPEISGNRAKPVDSAIMRVYKNWGRLEDGLSQLKALQRGGGEGDSRRGKVGSGRAVAEWGGGRGGGGGGGGGSRYKKKAGEFSWKPDSNDLHGARGVGGKDDDREEEGRRGDWREGGRREGGERGREEWGERGLRGERSERGGGGAWGGGGGGRGSGGGWGSEGRERNREWGGRKEYGGEREFGGDNKQARQYEGGGESGGRREYGGRKEYGGGRGGREAGEATGGRSPRSESGRRSWDDVDSARSDEDADVMAFWSNVDVDSPPGVARKGVDQGAGRGRVGGDAGRGRGGESGGERGAGRGGEGKGWSRDYAAMEWGEGQGGAAGGEVGGEAEGRAEGGAGRGRGMLPRSSAPGAGERGRWGGAEGRVDAFGVDDWRGRAVGGAPRPVMRGGAQGRADGGMDRGGWGDRGEFGLRNAQGAGRGRGGGGQWGRGGDGGEMSGPSGRFSDAEEESDNDNNDGYGANEGDDGDEGEYGRYSDWDNSNSSWGTPSLTPSALRGEPIYGVSPVLAALLSSRRRIHTLYTQEGLQDGLKGGGKRKDKAAVERVLRVAEQSGVERLSVSKHELNLLSGNRPHQGLVLDASGLQLEPIEALPVWSVGAAACAAAVGGAGAGEAGAAAEAAAGAAGAAVAPPVWVALDEVTDPQNLGAILRSAHFLGAAGVVVCAKNSAPLSAVVSKASAGALEIMQVHHALEIILLVRAE